MTKFLTTVLLCFFTTMIFPQVTIGGLDVPKIGALLDLKQSNALGQNSSKGLGLPRVALQAYNKLEPCVVTDASSMASHIGLMVYNTNDDTAAGGVLKKGLYFWDGNSWQPSGMTNAQGFGPWYQISNPKIPSRTADTNSFLNAKAVIGGTSILDNATLSVHGDSSIDGDFILTGTMVVDEALTIGSSSKPDPNSLLDMKTNADGSSNKGFLLPRISLQALNSSLPITNSTLTEGMTVYNSNQSVGAKGIYYWKNSKWNAVAASWNIANTTESATSNISDVYQMGKVGIGTNAPTSQLHIKPATGIDPLKLEGVNQGSYSANSILTLTSDGLVKKIASSDIGTAIANATSIPVPNVYSLDTEINDFLTSAGAGGTQIITNLKATKSAIKGLSFDASSSKISFPPGIYQITVVYEAEHNVANCTLSSYFVDFPTGVRIHSTASHNQGALSNHGGSIIFTAAISGNLDWIVKLGRGQSGNCYGSGMKLIAKSTQISIFRIGDV